MQFFPSREVFLSLGPVAIHWYGLMYLLGFLAGIYLIPRLMKYRDLLLSSSDRDSLVLYVFFGVILGGRIGYVLFYGLEYYLAHPLLIFAVWQGGMASHGGFIGVGLALFLFARRYKISFLRLLDILSIPFAIGLAFGRIGNFINAELYGTVTTLPWGMTFPGVEGARHPTQVYAVIKDLFIASVCFGHLSGYFGRTLKIPDWMNRPGVTISIFLMLYGVLRSIVEIFRYQPNGYVIIEGIPLTEGQLLSIPVFILGVVLLFSIRRVSKL